MAGNFKCVGRRILLLITDLQLGGTPTVVRELAIRLRDAVAADDVEIEVACLSGWGPVADQLRAARIPVHAFGARGASDLQIIPKLVHFIRHRRFDTVFSFLVHANVAGAIASRFCRGVRFIQSIQTTQPWPRWHWIAQRIAQYAADAIIVPSPSAAEVAREWADVPAEKIQVIPNAVDPSIAPRPRRDEQPGAPVRIGFLGRLDPIKRLPDLLGAIALLDGRFILAVHGDGEDRPRIEAEIARLGIGDRVTLYGATDSPQAVIASFDLLVLPSQAEGFGLVLIEAMAAGVPVVATDVSGIRDVVRDGITGLLVPVGSPSGLAAGIRRVMEDGELRARMIDQARREAQQRFSWSSVLPEYLRVLQIDQRGG